MKTTMQANRKNIRFWIYHNDTPIKLSMRDGDTYTVHSGGPTEEGYDWMTTSYTRKENKP